MYLAMPHTKHLHPEDDSDKGFSCPIMTGCLYADDKAYPIQAYPMSDSSDWPKTKGIYAVSGIYPGNEGKLLVGKTFCRDGFRGRWMAYRNKLTNDRYANPYLQNSFNRHGLNQFVCWVIEESTDPESLGHKEWFWFDRLNSSSVKQGWNIHIPNDDGSSSLAPETKEKLRQINLGNKHTDETRAKMSRSRSGTRNYNWGKKGPLSPLSGRKHSEERRRRLSEATSGERNHAYGKEQSKEHRIGISKASPKSIPIRLGSPNGEIMSFANVGSFCIQYEIDKDSFKWFMMSGKVGESHSGWKMIELYQGLIRNKKPLRHQKVKTPDGEVVTFTNLASFCDSRGLKKGAFHAFLTKAKIGRFHQGYQKIEDYVKR